VIAGAFQFTPLKHVCLRTCRSPLGFRAVCRRRDDSLWIAALTLLVAMEKLAPKGELLAKALGALMIGAGAARLIWRAS
jgi:predicted metal-binding membrane protein